VGAKNSWIEERIRRRRKKKKKQERLFALTDPFLEEEGRDMEANERPVAEGKDGDLAGLSHLSSVTQKEGDCRKLRTSSSLRKRRKRKKLLLICPEKREARRGTVTSDNLEKGERWERKKSAQPSLMDEATERSSCSGGASFSLHVIGKGG